MGPVIMKLDGNVKEGIHHNQVVGRIVAVIMGTHTLCPLSKTNQFKKTVCLQPLIYIEMSNQSPVTGLPRLGTLCLTCIKEGPDI